MKAEGIILAAGMGARLGAERPKALLSVGRKTLLEWSILAFDEAPSTQRITAVLPYGWLDALEPLWPDPTKTKDIGGLVGGTTRQRSARIALETRQVPEVVDAVVIHDAARPFVTPELIERALAGLEHADGAVCAVPVSDTLKRADGDYVSETVARDGLWRAQTPQAFKLDVLRDAHARAEREGFEATDDAQLVEHYGGKVVIVPGDERNIKITTRADLVLAEALLSEPAGRSGVGYDAHAFADGRPLVLGGVTIRGARGLAGHSDADVLSHAICDALLGAAALGDIGVHFPSSDERWKGAASTEFLSAVARMLGEAGFRTINVDATVILERPAIGPYREEMRARIAEALGIDAGQVGVKASTTDELGMIGAGDGAAAVAIARVEPG